MFVKLINLNVSVAASRHGVYAGGAYINAVVVDVSTQSILFFSGIFHCYLSSSTLFSEFIGNIILSIYFSNPLFNSKF